MSFRTATVRVRALAADPGVRGAAASRMIALVGAPVSLYLAATRLPPNTQGYYFVAINILAIAQLCELGLGTIIVQFASHEWPSLRWGSRGGLDGDPTALDAISAILLAAIRWFAVAALVLFVIAGIGGELLYGPPMSGDGFGFAVLWCSFIALTAVYLPVIPFLCVAEGCGDLVALQRMRSWQAGGILIGIWTGIILGGPLLAAWIAAALQLTIAVAWLARRHPALLQSPSALSAHFVSATRGIRERYRTEQGRSARLWLALNLAPQLLVPVLLWLRGGDVAGRLGVTLALALAPLTISIAWLHGRYPSLGALAADGHSTEFETLARRATIESVAVFVACALALIGAVQLLPFALPALAVRVMPTAALVALLCGSLASLLQQAMAGYLRAFRDEAIAKAIVTGNSAVVVVSAGAARIGGATAMVWGYAAASLLIALPIAVIHFATMRRKRQSGA